VPGGHVREKPSGCRMLPSISGSGFVAIPSLRSTAEHPTVRANIIGKE